MKVARHTEMLRALDSIRRVVRAELGSDLVGDELDASLHGAVATEANRWAEANQLGVTLTEAQVARLEQVALGHCDYIDKFPLYVAEALYVPDGPLAHLL